MMMKLSVGFLHYQDRRSFRMDWCHHRHLLLRRIPHLHRRIFPETENTCYQFMYQLFDWRSFVKRIVTLIKKLHHSI
jgi:hypothetical protein